MRALLDLDTSSRHALDREATHAEIFGHHSHKGRAAPVPRPETVSRLMHLQDTMAQGNKQQLNDEKVRSSLIHSEAVGLQWRGRRVLIVVLGCVWVCCAGGRARGVRAAGAAPPLPAA